MAKPAGSTNELEMRTQLAKLLPLWPHELSDDSIEGRRRRIALLQRALRAERQRGLAGNWTYDVARHAALLACYRAEAAAFKALEMPAGQSCSKRRA